LFDYFERLPRRTFGTSSSFDARDFFHCVNAYGLLTTLASAILVRCTPLFVSHRCVRCALHILCQYFFTWLWGGAHQRRAPCPLHLIIDSLCFSGFHGGVAFRPAHLLQRHQTQARLFHLSGVKHFSPIASAAGYYRPVADNRIRKSESTVTDGARALQR
jgi:hypothetical protein